MKAWRLYCRALPLAIVAMIGPVTAAPSAQRAPVQPLDDAAILSSGLRPEVRLRKLHLVRPDLIPYPIAFEVYC